jgi:hypothetical protein
MDLLFLGLEKIIHLLRIIFCLKPYYHIDLFENRSYGKALQDPRCLRRRDK